MANNEKDTATLASVIQKGIENANKELHTSMPAIIEEFDPETQLAKVQPAIKRIFRTTESDSETLTPVDIPPLINVPVVFPRGGGFSLTFPVKKGDECLLVFCERSIDGWHNSGEVSEPLAMRFHSLSDATAFVGISSTPKKIPNYDPDNVELRRDDNSARIIVKDKNIDIIADTQIKLKRIDGTAIITMGLGTVDVLSTIKTTVTAPDIEVIATTKVLVTSPEVELSGNTLIKGNLTVEGDTALTDTVTSDGTNISNTHKHDLVVTGTDNSGEPI